MNSLPITNISFVLFLIVFLSGLFICNSVSNSVPSTRHWIKWINNITELHQLAMKCLKDSKSPYGFVPLSLKSEEERQQEYQRMLNITQYYRSFTVRRWSHYRGPFIEDVWISRFCCNKPLSTFGPYIPVFITWFNIFKRDKNNYLNHLENITSFFKPDFLYITVSANDLGIEGVYKHYVHKLPPNLLIISASGRGHIPCLMHLADIEPVTMLKQKYQITFAGKLTRWQRKRIVNESKALLGNAFYSNRTSEWIDRYRESLLIMAPRGYARGCFRSAEIWQLGMVPVFIFDDYPWVPYLNSAFPWKHTGFVYLKKDIPEMAKMVLSIDKKKVDFMREIILRYRNTHFTMAATMNQIEMFFKYGYDMSDLRCNLFLPTS